MRRRAWYKASEYTGFVGHKTLGDGSLIAGESVGQDQFGLTRTYPWGFKQVIEYRLLPNGEKKYLREDPGPASPNQLTGEARTKQFERELANGEVRITARGPIPGAGLGVVHDSAIGRKAIGQSDEWERQAAELQIDRALRSDYSTMHTYDDPPLVADIGIKNFDASKPGATPPLPAKRAT